MFKLHKNKIHILILFTLIVVSFYIRSHNISETMPFIGDQAWFYLSAKDFLASKEIPLVGIPSSHTWINQGPYWTYILSALFYVVGFHPMYPAYLSIAVGLLTIIFMFYVAKKMFTKTTAYFACILYALSPIIIEHDRFTYHTTPIHFLTLAYIYTLYRWITGNNNYFFASLVLLTVMYNFELSTQVLWIVQFSVVTFGLLKRSKWMKVHLNFYSLTTGLIAVLTPLIPVIIHDVQTDYSQTIGLLKEGLHKIIRLFDADTNNSLNIQLYTHFIPQVISKTFVLTSITVSITIFILSIITSIEDVMRKNNTKSHALVLLILLVSTSGLVLINTASHAYLPIMYPPIFLLYANFISRLYTFKPTRILALVLVTIIIFFNFIHLNEKVLQANHGLSKRIEITRTIINQSGNKPFDINVSIPGNEHRSNRLNYDYLLLWLGKKAEAEAEMTFKIIETKTKIKIQKTSK